MHDFAKMTQLILGPIVGGVNHSGAFLWGRADGPGTLFAWLGRNPDLSDAYQAGASLPLAEENGYAGVAPVQNLAENSRYYYALTLTNSLPVEPNDLFVDGSYPSFFTFPPPGKPESFSFAFGSCFRPMNADSGQIFHAIDRRRSTEDLRFILLLGDQIYADDYPTNGIGKIAMSLADYRGVYQYVWSRPAFKKMLLNLPAFMTLDDHEVDDDWRWTDPDRHEAYIPWWDRIKRLFEGRPIRERRIPTERVRHALQAYWEHQAMHARNFIAHLNIDNEGQYQLTETDPGSFAYTFEVGAAAFFVLDTRTMRVLGSGVKTILGSGQWQALEEWLLRVNDTYPVKFLVSSSAILFQMWLDIPKDRWNGFVSDRERLFRFLAQNKIKGVHILTGDLHSAHAIHAEVKSSLGENIDLWEFCSTPFEQVANTLASKTRTRVSSKFLGTQECKFIVEQNNFGVVRVEFDAHGAAHTHFTVYDQGGNKLHQV